MKPVAVVRFAPHEGPGYFAQVAADWGVEVALVAVDAGMPLPALEDCAGVVLMGGPMSVNDPLPWIPQVLELIAAAVDRGVPVLGHCLGGQLLARALGAHVGPNAHKEIGWHPVQVRPGGEAWFGDVRSFVAFHWHGETFQIPPGATWLAESPACPHQAFALGPHVGLQFHVEMTAGMVRQWAETGAEEIIRDFGPWVQEPQSMIAAIPQWIAPLQAVARTLYGRWLQDVRARSGTATSPAGP